MTWRDELRRVKLADGRELVGASFRGVPFFVESADRTGGRRTVTHEFPGRDQPYIEDLGRRARTFSLDGYVLGADYLAQRNALLDALEKTGGPGELIHPFYGTLHASCSGLSVRETRTDGGVATFRIEFVESAEVFAPAQVPDLAAKVDVAADAARVAVESELADSYDASGEPGYAVASLAAELEARSQGMRDALGPIVATTQELARLDVDIQSIVSDATSLIRDPGEALAAFAGVIGNLESTIAAVPGKVLDAFVDSYRVAAQAAAIGSTATRILERANQAALLAALRRTLAIEAARLLTRITFATIDDALAGVASVVDLLDEQASTAGDAAYPALIELRAAVTRAVPGDAELARVVTVERDVAVPSLLLAYQLYGDVERELALVARNRARHPGFMVGALQVLSR